MARPNFDEFRNSSPFAMVLKILAILCAFGAGTYSLYLFIIYSYFGIGFFAALLYVLVFSIIIPSAELGLMSSSVVSVFARFLTSPMGRAFMYVFMGGVVLGHGIGGWVVGVFLFVVAVINIIAGCLMYA
ncbi:hypothetical protein, conserved [Leishmania tarentolae]|uniref:Uncharacterized protein n=1 Tax=Leishmania tarentolae TaxID=5689 RepID=A0A640KAL3_LEITA|nr:hypothetical protein, conserved [Leishmania tarentolae]